MKTFNVPVGKRYHHFRYNGKDLTPQQMADEAGAVVVIGAAVHVPQHWNRRRRREALRNHTPNKASDEARQ